MQFVRNVKRAYSEGRRQPRGWKARGVSVRDGDQLRPRWTPHLRCLRPVGVWKEMNKQQRDQIEALCKAWDEYRNDVDCFEYDASEDERLVVDEFFEQAYTVLNRIQADEEMNFVTSAVERKVRRELWPSFHKAADELALCCSEILVQISQLNDDDAFTPEAATAEGIDIVEHPDDSDEVRQGKYDRLTDWHAAKLNAIFDSFEKTLGRAMVVASTPDPIPSSGPPPLKEPPAIDATAASMNPGAPPVDASTPKANLIANETSRSSLVSTWRTAASTAVALISYLPLTLISLWVMNLARNIQGHGETPLQMLFDKVLPEGLGAFLAISLSNHLVRGGNRRFVLSSFLAATWVVRLVPLFMIIYYSHSNSVPVQWGNHALVLSGGIAATVGALVAHMRAR
jgi:hypothetical protein